MKEKYQDCIEKVSQIIFEEIATKEENLTDKIFEIDTDLLSLLRAIGSRVMSMLLTMLITQVTTQTKKPGWKIQRNPQIKYTTLFGEFKIKSPYLWNKKLKIGIRPVANFLGITAGVHSVGLTRALADFGAEESFGQASLRFEEHYGFKVESGKLRREVIKVAKFSEIFVHKRLEQSQKIGETNPQKKTKRLLLELDGCHLRTGGKIAGDENKLTKIRKIKKSKRQIDWRESRVGACSGFTLRKPQRRRCAFARPVDKKEERTFVAKMAKYPDIIQQLVGAAKDRGLFEKSQVFAVADGGIGLKEALEDAFPGVQFILDRPHLKEHLYAGVEAMELPTKTKKFIYDSLISLIARGKVRKIIKNLQNYQGVGAKRIANLANYLIRFRDCVHYQKFERLGLPIGSGEVESAHKYIPQKRLKIAGATWHPDTINPMLALRIIRANHWWSDFWNQYRSSQNLNVAHNEFNFN